MRGDAPVKDDTAVTDADIASSNLVLWGDPQSNKVLARIADKLPIQWTCRCGRARRTRRFPAATQRAGHDLSESAEPEEVRGDQQRLYLPGIRERNNSWQVAELPDYAVVDLTTPPDARWPGKIAAAGFFGEKWELLANDGK